MTLTGTPSAFPDSRTPGGLEITSEEMERFKDSMKNDEFKKLFFDYMNEISDPNNKKVRVYRCVCVEMGSTVCSTQTAWTRQQLDEKS